MRHPKHIAAIALLAIYAFSASLFAQSTRPLQIKSSGTGIGQMEAIAISANSGTSANQFAAGDDERITSAMQTFNVRDYGASGSAFTTTGSISAGSSTLVVASASTFAVGQGILIKGSGSGGGNLVRTISNISGTTITLSGTAITSVSSGTVQHDDSAAINLACAAAYNAGGGVVYFPKKGSDGYYRVNGPLLAETNSIIGFPVVPATLYPYVPVFVSLLGESLGSISADGRTPSGVCLDASDYPNNGSNFPAVVSSGAYFATAYNTTGCNFYNLSLNVRNIVIFTPSATNLCGIMAANSSKFIVRDSVIFTKWSGTVPIFNGWGTTGPVNPYATSSIGIFLPQVLNVREVVVESTFVCGFENGIIASEHTLFKYPSIAYCSYGVNLQASNHYIAGSVSIENCTNSIWLSGASVVDFSVSIEDGYAGVSPGAWWTPNAHISGSGSIAGMLRFEAARAGGDSVNSLVISGVTATNLRILNLRDPIPTTTVSSGTQALTGQSSEFQIFTGTGLTQQLPPIAERGSMPIRFKNAGSGNLTISAPASTVIYDSGTASTLVITPGNSRTFIGSGTTYYAQ